MDTALTKETWNSNYRHRAYCKLTRKPKDDDYLELEITYRGKNTINEYLANAGASICLTEMDSKTEIPYQAWSDDGVLIIKPAYWPKELYAYYVDND